MTLTKRIAPHAIVLAAAAALGGCAQTFPVIGMNADEKAFEETLRGQADSDAKVALAQLYFDHNLIEQADAVLSPLVAAEPKNAQALAWYGANNCKRAAARGPWLMGMDKLMMVKTCLDQTEQALALAPADFTVQMVQMNTGAEVDKFGSTARANQTRLKIESAIAASPQALQGDALAQFYVTAARIDRKLGNLSAAAGNLERAVPVAVAPDTRQSIDAERKRLASL